MRRSGLAVLLSVAMLCEFLARPAHAYIDPGTGSYVLQTVLGVAFGAAYAVKLYWRQISAYIHSRGKPPERKPEG